MSSNPPNEPVVPPERPRRKWLVYLAKMGAGSLVLSIVIHLIFVIIAAIYVVSIVTEQRKVAFAGGGSGDGTGGVASEVRHQVSVARQNTTPIPSALSQKIVVDGAASVALPELPSLSMPSSAVSSSPASSGSLGGGLGTGAGTGAGAGPGTGALRMMPFGLSRAPSSGALAGTLYLMPSAKYKTNLDEVEAFKKWMSAFQSAGWPEGTLASLPKSTKQLYTTQILVPKIPALDAPKAFGIEPQKSLVRFLIRYRGKVSPPRNGRWRFVGFGDDVLIVRVSGKVVLESNRLIKTPANSSKKFYVYPGAGSYDVGEWVQMNATTSYNLEIYMSEEPREGSTTAILLVEEEGATYKKTPEGQPILPPWTLAPDPKVSSGEMTVPTMKDKVPVWVSRGM